MPSLPKRNFERTKRVGRKKTDGVIGHQGNLARILETSKKWLECGGAGSGTNPPNFSATLMQLISNNLHLVVLFTVCKLFSFRGLGRSGFEPLKA